MATTKIEMRYEITDRPTNGSAGQDCGTYEYDALPARIQRAIEREPDAVVWVLPALSEGDCGEELDELETVVRRVARKD